MTHEEIKNSMRDGTIGEYLSLAVANGWSKVKICEVMSDKFGMSWSTVADNYNRFIDQYGKVGEIESNGRPGTKICCYGVIYESKTAAAEALGIKRSSLEHKRVHGEQVLIYQGRRYKNKDKLLKGEKISKWKYDRIRDQIRREREYPIFYV